MKKISIFLIGLPTILSVSFAKDYDDSYVPPTAPIQFSRPADFKGGLPYELTLEEIHKKESKNIERQEKLSAEKTRIASVLQNGKWKPTQKSLNEHECPEWFKDAKFGMIIDWGLWSVANYAPKKNHTRNAMYPDWYEDYMYSDKNCVKYHKKNWGEDFQRDHFIRYFNNKKFDADKLIDIAKKSGMKYVIPFAKHHSGYCTWDSSYTLRTTVNMNPHRNFSKELLDACKKRDMKFGFYFSLDEWEYPMIGEDGNLFIRKWGNIKSEYTKDVEYKASGKIAVKNFVEDYIVPQAVEFIDKYSPDLIWLDGDWETNARDLGSFEIASYFYNANEGKKNVAINDRFGMPAEGQKYTTHGKVKIRKWLRCAIGDYYTDEWHDTAKNISLENYHPWEACRPISQSYGYNWEDDESRAFTIPQMIDMLIDIVARGGNLVITTGLDADGLISDLQLARLEAYGKWLAVNGDAIYATRPLAPYIDENVAYTKKKDNKTAYVIIRKPSLKSVKIKADISDGDKITKIGDGKIVDWKRCGDGEIELSLKEFDEKLPYALKYNLK